MKSHTGGVMSFGTGGFVWKSSKQKLSTESSTDAEVVGGSDYLPNTLWVQVFLGAQGYEMDTCIFEQNNARERNDTGAELLHVGRPEI